MLRALEHNAPEILRARIDLPHWAPLDEDAGFQQIGSAKAIAAGATFRPLADTARDAWRWYRSHFFKDSECRLGGFGITREGEEDILGVWAAAGAG